MVKCVVSGCPNRQVDGNVNGELFNRPPKRFFSFPTDPARVKVWLAALRETDKQDSTKNHLICEDHFLPEDISSSEVTSDAIPIMPPYLDGSLGLSSMWGAETSEEEEQWATGGCDDDDSGDGDAPAAAESPAQDLPQQDLVGGLEDPPPEEGAEKTSPSRRKRKQSNQFKKVTKRDVPLGLLTLRFLRLLLAAPDRSVDLWQAAESLQTRKRRLNDITNILYGIDFIQMESANNIKWTGGCSISSLLSENQQENQLENKQENQSELENLKLVEDTLDGLIESCTQELFNMTDDAENAAFAYVTHKDIRQLRVFQEQTMIVIKAPEETKLEVSAPKEDSIQVHLKATKSPIMVVTCEVGSDDAVTSDPEDKSGVLSTLEESRIRTAALLTGASYKKEDEDEERISSRETQSEAPTTLAHLETQKVDRCIRKRTTGQASVGKKLTEEDGKMGPRCQSVCCIRSAQHQCGQIRETDRESIFNHFWQEMDWMQRKIYVASLVDVFPVQRRSAGLLRSRRSSYMHYHLKVNGQRMRVCKSMFLSTLGVKQRYVFRCAAGKQQEKVENVCWSDCSPAIRIFPPPTQPEVVLKASLCSALSTFVASTESQWFGV